MKCPACRFRQRRSAARVFPTAGRFSFPQNEQRDRTFAGVAGSGARLPLKSESALGLIAPIGEAGLMRKADARREEFAPGIVFDVGVGPVGSDGFIERFFARKLVEG